MLYIVQEYDILYPFLKDVYALVSLAVIYVLGNRTDQSHVTNTNCDDWCFCKYETRTHLQHILEWFYVI